MRQWREADLMNRAKSNLYKVKLAGRLREETLVTLKRIAVQLQVGTARYVNNRLYRWRKGMLVKGVSKQYQELTPLRCLSASESAARAIRDCKLRAQVRIANHIACYAACGFLPTSGVPMPEGVEVGIGMLAGTIWRCR